MMRKVFTYIVICSAVAIFAKCEKADEGILYHYYFSTHWANLEDSIKAENCLKPKRLAKTTSFVGNVQDTDLQAIGLFEEMASIISVDELDSLHLQPASTFTYAVSRWTEPHNPYSGTVILDSYTYPNLLSK